MATKGGGYLQHSFIVCDTVEILFFYLRRDFLRPDPIGWTGGLRMQEPQTPFIIEDGMDANDHAKDGQSTTEGKKGVATYFSRAPESNGLKCI